MFVRTLLCATLAVLCSASAHAALPEAMQKLLQAARIPEDAVGAVVLRGNSVLLSHNAERSMAPASTMKVVTSMVALDQLGPIFRGRTELRTSAELVGGVLKGDLVLRGGADADFNEDSFSHMLQTLRNQGVNSIRGDLVIDRQLFQPARADLDTPAFDNSTEFRYNVIPDAALLNTNLLHVDMMASDKRLRLAMSPELEGVSISADMTLINGPCAAWENGWRAPDYTRSAGGKLQVVLHGTFPKNCNAATSINVLDRRDYADRLFRATWRRLGGSFSGEVREAPASNLAPVMALASDTTGGSGAIGTNGTIGTTGMPLAAAPAGSSVSGAQAEVGTRMLTDHVARALPEVLRDMNKNSDNTLARLVYLSLGSLEADAYFGSRPASFTTPDSTSQRADQLIRLWFHRHGIDTQGLVLDNGSGLSRSERIHPAQMAAVLQQASASPWAPEFLSSLPIAALDGTMRKRLRGSAAATRARIKTGSLENVVAIAGVVPDANNQPCVVVAMINADLLGKGAAARGALDALIEWVALSAPTSN